MSKKLKVIKPVVKAAEPKEEVKEKPVVNNCVGDLCKTKDFPCNKLSKRGYTCTLPEGHKGNHVACGSMKHNLESWS